MVVGCFCKVNIYLYIFLFCTLVFIVSLCYFFMVMILLKWKLNNMICFEFEKIMIYFYIVLCMHIDIEKGVWVSLVNKRENQAYISRPTNKIHSLAMLKEKNYKTVLKKSNDLLYIFLCCFFMLCFNFLKIKF